MSLWAFFHAPLQTEILCKWNGNFRSNRLEREKWSTSEGRPFIPENFHLNCAFHLPFNWLDQKVWLNEKHPVSLNSSNLIHKIFHKMYMYTQLQSYQFLPQILDIKFPHKDCILCYVCQNSKQ